MTTNFYLKNSKKENKNKTRIICYVRSKHLAKSPIKIFTEISILAKHWSKNQKVLSADPKSAAYNKELERFANRVQTIYDDAIDKKIIPDLNYFKRELAPKEQKDSAFWNVWSQYLESRKGIFKQHSYDKFEALKNHLLNFEKQKGSLILDTIDEGVLESLQTYFYSKSKDKQPLNTQTTSKYIGLLKMFLSWATKRKFTANTDWRNFKAITQPDSLKVIMTDDDLEKIRNADLEFDYLKRVRSLFLLACGTALRYSDLSKINNSHLKSDEDGYFLQIRQKKTDDFVEIPLTTETLGIVQQLIAGELNSQYYDARSGKQIKKNTILSNQKMNSYVKELCRVAGINEQFTVNKYIGRIKSTETVEKWELVSTHTGRRTFATNLLNKGVPAETVMQFTGHRDYKSFSKYVNIPKKAAMRVVRDALTKGNEGAMKVNQQSA
jgi:integrase